MVTQPRLVVAAAASGQGKTTVSVGLMGALRAHGHAVAPAKCGPDYIDPGYHELATGRPSRNLDPWLTSPELVAPLFLRGCLHPKPADVAVIEGVMGLFDGRLGADGFASTAHVAALTDSPVLLVVDISSAARTVGALVRGLATHDPAVRVAGVVLNKAGSDRHAAEVRRAVEQQGYPVLGVLPRDAGISAPSRHLGLVPASERHDAQASLDRLAEQTAQHIDIDAVFEIACTAPQLDAEPWAPPVVDRPARRVAVAGGRAFTFHYAETADMLAAAGCEPVRFDPATDRELPSGTAGLYLGGGFPEAHLGALATNTRLLAQVRDAVSSGLPTVAECAGLLYLCESLDGRPMAGVLPARAAMQPRLTLGYRDATLTVDTLLGPAGTTVRGHEFHRTRTDPGHGTAAAWHFPSGPEGFALDPARTGRATVHASYLHTHWAGAPQLAAAFADAVHEFTPVADARPVRDTWSVDPRPVADAREQPAVSDAHHGDDDIRDRPDLVDLAVNVRLPAPPAWLARELADGIAGLGAYPDATAARDAIARRHGVDPSMVLPTAGGAEAFTLIARAIEGRTPLIVEPQFTEPAQALAATGRTADRLVLRADHGFVLDPAALDPAADLVFVGNPTNPTGVLHPRATLHALRRPGRVLVIDEAFADAVLGETESCIGPEMDSVLVVRSLTKTWGVAGLRAGYVIGDPRLVELLRRQQPHWSVSSPALTVMLATTSDRALRESAQATRDLASAREHLVGALERRGLRPVPGVAPFVLVEVGDGVREALRHSGFAVRRCDTFAGLSDRWIRIAVRDPHTIDTFLRALDGTLAITRSAAAAQPEEVPA